MSKIELPPNVRKYAESPLFSHNTVPAKLLKEHSTKAGVWGKISVCSGKLRFASVGEGASDQILDSRTPGIIVPEDPHFVEPIGAVEFKVEFYR